MNVTIKIEKIYFIQQNGVLGTFWYSEQCAKDYVKEYGGEIVVYERVFEIPQPCNLR